MTQYEITQLSKMTAKNLAEILKTDEELADVLFPTPMMGIDEAAEFVGIPKETLYKKIGQIPHEKVGKRLVFTARGLTRWVKRKASVAFELDIDKKKKAV